MSRHRARGHGRFRTAPPRHLRAGPPLPLRPILTTCAALSLAGVALIGGRLVQDEVRQPAPITFTPMPPQVVAAPSPYTPKWTGARAEPQRSKNRPPVLLGAPSAEGLTLFCVDRVGPLATAVIAGNQWVCRPFLGAPRRIAMGAACRFLHGPAAWATRADIDDPLSWRCYRDGS